MRFPYALEITPPVRRYSRFRTPFFARLWLFPIFLRRNLAFHLENMPTQSPAKKGTVQGEVSTLRGRWTMLPRISCGQQVFRTSPKFVSRKPPGPKKETELLLLRGVFPDYLSSSKQARAEPTRRVWMYALGGVITARRSHGHINFGSRLMCRGCDQPPHFPGSGRPQTPPQ